MKRLPILVLVLALLVPATAHAQGDDTLQCTGDEITTALTNALTALQDAQALTGPDLLTALRDVRLTLAALDSTCTGLHFEGRNQVVFDPMTIPPGIYRVTVFTEGALMVQGTILEGQCGDYGEVGDTVNLIIVAEASDDQGAQTVFKSEGCQILWETVLATGPFRITFEQMQ